jgi:hypothetical protein
MRSHKYCVGGGSGGHLLCGFFGLVELLVFVAWSGYL